MPVLLANGALVRELLPMRECVEVMAETLRALARGDAVLPLRGVMPLPGKQAVLGTMPAYLADREVMGLKVISVFPGNLGTPYDSHQGAVLLFETVNGRLLGILDASEITGIRTAAVSAVATRALARQDAARLGVLGSGVQAQRHIEAMQVARRIDSVRVWSRDPEHARQFAERESRRHGVDIAPAASARDAVRDADVICTTTSAREPVLLGEWIPEGAHVNAVGACMPSARELDTAAVARARLFVDCRESALHEAGDILIPKHEGCFGDEHIAGEIGELLLGQVAGRRSPADVTLFESLGLAVEDVAAAHHVYERALAAGAGRWIEVGGTRHES